MTTSAHAGDGPRYEVVTKLQVLRCGRPSRDAVSYLVWPQMRAAEIARIDDDVWQERLSNGVVVQGHVLGRRVVAWSLSLALTGKDEPPYVSKWKQPRGRSLQTFFYTGAIDCRQIALGQILVTSSWSEICDTCDDPFDWNRFLHDLPEDTAQFLTAADQRASKKSTKR